MQGAESAYFIRSGPQLPKGRVKSAPLQHQPAAGILQMREREAIPFALTSALGSLRGAFCFSPCMTVRSPDCPIRRLLTLPPAWHSQPDMKVLIQDSKPCAAIKTHVLGWQLECWRLSQSKTQFSLEGLSERDIPFCEDFCSAHEYEFKRLPSEAIFTPLN